MSSTYYRVQIFDRDPYGSHAVTHWKSVWNQFNDLKSAKELYKDTVLNNSMVDVRLVRAFISEYSGEERVLEVLEFRAGRP